MSEEDKPATLTTDVPQERKEPSEQPSDAIEKPSGETSHAIEQLSEELLQSSELTDKDSIHIASPPPDCTASRPPSFTSIVPPTEQPKPHKPLYPPSAAAAGPGNRDGNNNGNDSRSPNTHTVRSLSSITDKPFSVICPRTGSLTTTRVEYHSGNTTFVLALMCCSFHGLWCLPFLCDETKDAQHFCSACGAKLATWHRSRRLELHKRHSGGGNVVVV